MSDQTETKKSEEARDRALVSQLFYVAIGAGLLFAALAFNWCCGWRSVFTALLWALACFASATVVGFLFGIPKVGGGTQANGTGLTTSPNTNLTDISDWLTKIITGLGLVNLTKIPGEMRQLGQVLAHDLGFCGGTSPYLAYSVGLIIAFLSLGFLFGYLSTRLFLSAAFARADKKAQSILDDLQDVAANAPVTDPATGGDAAQPESELVEKGVRGATTEQRPQTTQERKDALEKMRSEYNVPFDRMLEQELIRKDLFDRMARLINADIEVRNWLPGRIRSPQDDPLRAGFARAVQLNPMKDDVKRLAQVADDARLEDVRLEIIEAFGNLFEVGAATEADLATVDSVFRNFLGFLNTYKQKLLIQFTLVKMEAALKRRATS
jgi:hypothetical protein